MLQIISKGHVPDTIDQFIIKMRFSLLTNGIASSKNVDGEIPIQLRVDSTTNAFCELYPSAKAAGF